MENIFVLPHDEVVRIDPAAVNALQDQLGDAGAEGVMCRAMEELANRLSLIERCYHQNERKALAKSARSLIAISEQVGLLLLAQVASDVARCAEGDEPAALAATLGRLIRLGDRSLTMVWETPEMSV